MSHVSYSLRRTFWFVWRWQADYDWGERSETGLSLGRKAARRRGRARLREAQKGRGPAAAERHRPTSPPSHLDRGPPRDP